jgi:TonB family protein
MNFRLALAVIAAAICYVKPAAAQIWYWCDPAGAYYPYVAACPVPWRAVNPTASPRPSAAPPAEGGHPASQPIPSGGYRAALSAWLESHKHYPDSARQRGEEGSAVLRFRVDRWGRVLNYAVVSSTGYADLDAAVEAMMRGASLPPFPPDMPASELEVSVTVHFAAPAAAQEAMMCKNLQGQYANCYKAALGGYRQWEQDREKAMGGMNEYERRAFERATEDADWENRPEHLCTSVKQAMYQVGCPSEYWESVEDGVVRDQQPAAAAPADNAAAQAQAQQHEIDRAASVCDAPPYGSTEASYRAFIETYRGILEDPDKALRNTCIAKYGGR